MLFWIAIAVTAALVAAALALSFRRGRAEIAGAADVALYRDQLDEVARDEARGVLTPAEAERVRIEVSRRLLAADKAATDAATDAAGGTRPTSGPLRPALWLGGLLILGSVLTYLGTAPILRLAGLSEDTISALSQRYGFEIPLPGSDAGGAANRLAVSLIFDGLGRPGYADRALATRLREASERKANRPNQAEAEKRFGRPYTVPADADPEYLALVAQLRAAVATHPDSLEGWQLLVRQEAGLGNWPAAAQAQERVIALTGDAAGADDHVTLALLLIRAAGGFVSPEAEAALARALTLDPMNGMARYQVGVMYAENGRFDLTMRFWLPLLAASKPDDPWVAPIRGQIEAVAAAAGVRYTLPPETAPAPPPGPTAADIAAAAGMDADDRSRMIRGMVESLDQRLARDGGPAKDWAQLIIALGVLGEAERARATWEKAQGIFAADPAALQTLRAAAVSAGVAG